MPIHKVTPGPRGLSCLTCRQRRKKCDRVRPVCERCTKGNFECLGYDNDDLASEPVSDMAGLSTGSFGRWDSQHFSDLDDTRPISPRQANPVAVSANVTPSESSIATLEPEVSFSINPLDPLGLCEVSGPSILAAGIMSQIILSQQLGCTSEFNGGPTLHSSRKGYDNVWPQNQSGSLARSTSMTPEADASRRRAMPSEVLRAVQDIGNTLGLLQRSIPPSVNANAQMRESYLTFTLKEYETARMCHYFQQPPKELIANLAVRMTRSGTILSFMYLGARIFRVLTDKTQNTNIQSCIRWVNRVDHEFTQNPLSNPPVAAIEDRLSGLLELAFLKFVVINTVAGYLLLQRSLPMFLQIVSNDPDLWSEHRGVLRISLPRALETPRYEVRRFVFYDTMCAFVLGVPPLGEYDSGDFPVVPENPPPLEWVHGVPVELIINIAQVHAWRSSHPGLANEEDWPVLELRTVAWKPGMEQLAGGDSVKMVERAAVQETWRHATLIYIYMGMCRVNSHDPRVRSSVQQIVRLMSLVTETSVNIHFSVPCLIAGIAACSEGQRAFLRNKLASFQNIRIWILRGAEFCAVLDHLWHGAAANGNASTWDDYVNSRCVMLPIQ